MYSRNKSVPSTLQSLTSEQLRPLLSEDSEFETSTMSSPSAVLDLGGLTSNWQSGSSLAHTVGNSKIRFQKPVMLAVLFFCGVLVIFYFSMSGVSLRSNSRYSRTYGDSFFSNLAKVESSTLTVGKFKERFSAYNSTYPLTAPGKNEFLTMYYGICFCAFGLAC